MKPVLTGSAQRPHEPRRQSSGENRFPPTLAVIVAAALYTLLVLLVLGLLIGGFVLLAVGVGIMAFRRREPATPAGPAVIDLVAAERGEPEAANTSLDGLLSPEQHETPTT